MIDGSFGLEMETFEFLNLLQVVGVMLSVICVIVDVGIITRECMLPCAWLDD
jgi:hypothetical protein